MRFAAGLSAGKHYLVDYIIEGVDVGYRWFAGTGATSLFPFGLELSYTSFDHGALRLTGGAQVGIRQPPRRQRCRAALPPRDASGKPLRLAGFAKIALQPGASTTAIIAIDPRLLAVSKDGR